MESNSGIGWCCCNTSEQAVLMQSLKVPVIESKSSIFANDHKPMGQMFI